MSFEDNIETVLEQLNPELIERFKTAIELGKWPDGNPLTEQQKSTCMQSIIWYEHKHLPASERSGFVPPKETPCGDDNSNDQAIKWK
ncbi:MAG: hypothetical protein ACI93R_001601 [Flavobacteriales bacterium]|jgi:uncharacterized protein YeaC (DUF1315 family)